MRKGLNATLKKVLVSALIALCCFPSASVAEPTEEEVQAAAVNFLVGLGAVQRKSYEFPMRIVPRNIPVKMKQDVEVVQASTQETKAYVTTASVKIALEEGKFKNARLLLIFVETPQGWILAGGKDLAASGASPKPSN